MFVFLLVIFLVLYIFQEDWVEMHSGISEGLKAGWLVPHICKEYKLEDGPTAHNEVINNTGTLGKRVFVL